MDGQHEQQPADQRQSCRCSLPESAQRAELIAGRLRLSVRLIEESAGGFAILFEQTPPLAVNDLVCLRAGNAWFEARVIYVGPIEPEGGEAAAAEAAAEAPPRPQGFRVGLRRLWQIDPPEGRPPSWFGPRLLCRLGDMLPGSTAIVVGGVIFSVAIVMIPLAAALLVFRGGRLWEKPSHGGGERVASLDSWEKPGADPPWTFAPGETGRTQTADASATDPSAAAAADPSAQAAAALRKTIDRLPGAMAFMIPEVARKLELTDSQRQKIREIIDAAAEALQQLEARIRPDNRQESAELRAVILREARRRALQILTDDQRALWRELTGEEAATSPR